jgi:hopanoid C-3 methylase
MRILLVQPTPFEEGRLGLENIVWLSEPVALTAVAASVPNHDVEIVDLRLEPENTLPHVLRRFRPDVVGTTSMTTDAYQAKAVLRMAKTMLPDCLTLIGGHHPTLSPEEFHEPFIDVIVKGEGEVTFAELIAAHHEVVKADPRGADRSQERGARVLERTRERLAGIDGIRFQTAGGWMETPKREQQRSLDSFPAPRRDLVRKYSGRYFFTVAQPMASIFTSRGCSFDCNFCAIWEFYERRTRYLSAEKIADQMAACDEPYIFLLDDNFLTDQKRLRRLVEVLRERKIEKFWMTQGRTDFIAQHPELMKDLASVGLMCVLSGFESNDDDALAALKKTNTAGNNKLAMEVLRENGIQSTGIFMARTDFETKDFAELYDYINEMGVVAPIVTIHTPLPGTQLEHKLQDKLLTRDRRFYDLLHAVTETKLPREEFYAEFAKMLWATMPSTLKALSWRQLAKRPGFWWSVMPNVPRFVWNARRNRIVHSDPRSYLADEVGVLDGKAQTRWNKAVPVQQVAEKKVRLPVIAS